MKYCVKCGKECVDEAVICTGCGCQLPPPVRSPQSVGGYVAVDAPSAGLGILSFFIPVLGLVLWLIWREQYPLKAKSCGKGALISVITSAVFFVVYFIFMIILIASMGSMTGITTGY